MDHRSWLKIPESLHYSLPRSSIDSNSFPMCHNNLITIWSAGIMGPKWQRSLHCRLTSCKGFCYSGSYSKLIVIWDTCKWVRVTYQNEECGCLQNWKRSTRQYVSLFGYKKDKIKCLPLTLEEIPWHASHHWTSVNFTKIERPELLYLLLTLWNAMVLPISLEHCMCPSYY